MSTRRTLLSRMRAMGLIAAIFFAPLLAWSATPLTLEGLRLHGRLQGGFATCIVLLLHAEVACVLSSAGHPAPFLN